MSENDSENKALEIMSQSKQSIEYNHQTHHTFLTSIRIYVDNFIESEQTVWISIILISVLCFTAVYHTKFSLVFVAALMIIFGALLFISSQLSKTKLVATANGIELPQHFHSQLNNKLKRKWAELNLLMFTRQGRSSDDPEQLVLGFTDNCTVELNIDGFTKDALESLILVINTYNPNVRQVPEAAMNNLKIDHTSMGKSALSFTGIWKEDLASRFGSTTFVPLEKGEKLANDAVEIIAQIAYGGLSAIYIANSKKFGTVIVKEAILPGSLDEEVRAKSLELFQRESQLLSRIKHARVAKVYDYFVENGRHYMLLEYIGGKNLRAFILEEGPQPEIVVFEWCKQLVEIITYLHSLDPPVIHRDLTPSNLILEKDGGITLIDFGAANNFIGTATGTIVGKSAYIPVEQFKGKAVPKSDVYALGCSLNYFLTGEDPRPFKQSSPRQKNNQLSPTFNTLIELCTSMEQKQRPSSEELRQQLDNVGKELFG